MKLIILQHAIPAYLASGWTTSGHIKRWCQSVMEQKSSVANGSVFSITSLNECLVCHRSDHERRRYTAGSNAHERAFGSVGGSPNIDADVVAVWRIICGNLRLRTIEK
jgi:hypothetical protein